jgi:hypothetical protein
MNIRRSKAGANKKVNYARLLLTNEHTPVEGWRKQKSKLRKMAGANKKVNHAKRSTSF